MKTSIATVSISGTLTEKLNAISGAGFDGVEIFEQDFIANERPPREIGNLIREFGLEITLFQPFRDFEGLPEPHRQKAFDRAERKFDLMQELGTDLMLICSSVHPATLGGIDRTAADFHELGDRAKARGIRVGFEALAWGKHINDHRDAWEIVRRADHPQIGLILDSFHTLGRKINPESIRSIPGDKIFFVQLADAPLIEMDLLYWSRHFRNMPGEGGLDVTSFMRAVMATGYSGPISLEIFNDEFRGGRPNLVASDGYRSLMTLMDDVRRAEPTLAIDMPKFPARSNCQGVEFIEFASQNEEANDLKKVFHTLGFAKVGHHKTKAVELWRQGDINLLINAEKNDFAGKAFDLRGTNVCDLGLKVDNAEDTMQRAKATGAKAFEQDQGEALLNLPAIRGLGGSVIHFLSKDDQSKVWEVDFDLDTSAHQGAGLLGVDHLAQTMNYDEMLSWSLFYTSLLNMQASPMLDVIDPDGLVRSQSVETPDNSLRLTLNGAQAHRTMAGKFLSQTFGAPVQHIAMNTEDIFQTAEKLAALGFEALTMADNYYDDLQARFSLSPQVIDQLRQNSVLYDEDASGSYLQIFSKPMINGLFFEIVKREGEYRGYGASNAPFRIAAQKRFMRSKGTPAG